MNDVPSFIDEIMRIRDEHDAKKMRTMLTKLAKNYQTGLFMVHASSNGEFEAVDPADDKNVTLTDVGSGTNDIDGVTAPNVGTGRTSRSWATSL